MPNYPLKSGFNRSTEHFYFFDYVVTEEAGEISFRFEVTDKRGKMAATSYNLTVKPTVIAPTSTPMVFEKIDGVLLKIKSDPIRVHGILPQMLEDLEMLQTQICKTLLQQQLFG
ncbi:MAG: hypothetical protein M3421_14475 [Bacteroidota bacterium]|nr:hypothetical protein [Bacteroidota bacterium]